MQQISPEEGKQCGFGWHSVSVLPHVLIPLADGTKLSAIAWFPHAKPHSSRFNHKPVHLLYNSEVQNENTKRFPAILEYLPYRWSDFTSRRDFQRHPWFCSHGYVCVRVDMRGTGNSEGLYFDEYSETELEDGCEVMAWIARQPWSNGKVGMYGKSWGGFNSLQVASYQPLALKAVISLYSTDDRYATDVHYMGGCILGDEMLPWASRMFMWNVAPPHPAYVPDWRNKWLERLDKASYPWVVKWLEHQTRDRYWQHGSICDDFTKVKCPVLAIGGWCDSYHDAVFRIVEHVPNSRGIIGPWAHDWPDCSKPGPNIAYLDECLKWWNHHLKGVENNAMRVPRLRLYLRHALKPAIDVNIWPGHWLSTDSWPVDIAKHTKTITFVPTTEKTGRRSLVQPSDPSIQGSYSVDIDFISEHGMRSGSWCCFGDNDLPADQKVEDALSTHWTTSPLGGDLPLLGFLVLNCTFSTEATTGVLAARICHVWPDGRSTLITYGLLNLCHRNGHGPQEADLIEPGKIYSVQLLFHSASYIVPKGHQLRMSLSTNYWPRMWPANHMVPLKVHLVSEGEIQTFLTLPIIYNSERNLPEADKISMENLQRSPRLGPPLYNKDDIAGNKKLSSQLDHNIKESKLIKYDDIGRQFIHNTRTAVENVSEQIYTILGGDALSAKVETNMQLKIEYPSSGIKTKIVTHSEMTSDEKCFYLLNNLEAFDGDTLVVKKSWKHEIVRHLC